MAWLRGPFPVLALMTAGVVEVLGVFGADPARLVVAGTMAAPLLWRRTHPVAALIVVTCAFAVQLPWGTARIFDHTFVGFVCQVLGAYCVGRHGLGPSARIVGFACALTGGLVIGVFDTNLLSGLLATAILAAPVWVGHLVRDRVAARRTLDAQARVIAESTEAAAESRAVEERVRVAADLQQGLRGQVESMLRDTREAIRRLDADPGTATSSIAEIERAGRAALGAMRSTLGVMREPEASPDSGVAASDHQQTAAAGGRPAWWLPLAVGGFAVVETFVLGREEGGAILPASLVLAVAMAATLAARRTRPVAAAVTFWGLACVFVVVLTASTAVLVIGMLLAGAAGAARSRSRRWWGLGVAVLGVIVINTAAGLAAVGDYVFPPVLMALAWLGGSAVRHQSALLAAIEEQAEDVRRVREVRASAAAARERLRLARDLHDIVAHHLMVMVVQAGAARRSVESGRPGVSDALAVVERTGTETLLELRELLALVEPGAARWEQARGLADLERLVERVRSSGQDVVLSVEGRPQSLPGGLDLVAHRIVQESLTNVIRHAGASSVAVRVCFLPTQLTLEVVDDGRGLPSGSTPGFGVTGMQERAEMYGGRCEVSTPADGGVRVWATLPLEHVGTPA